MSSVTLAALVERLEKAVTDEEAHEVLLAATNQRWPEQPMPNSADIMDWNKAFNILSGPSAGWIGIGVLMMPPKKTWTLHSAHPHSGEGPCARLYSGPKRLPWHQAKRLDCALVIAALGLRGGGSGQHQ